MTTSTIPVIRPAGASQGAADRLAVLIGAALVRWANARATRSVISHERRANAIERELALIERERRAVRSHELR